MEEGKRKRASGNLRVQIIEAALKVFGEHGFERSTTKAIAREAGVAEGTIFNYFPSKNDILFSFLEDEVVGQLPAVFSDAATGDLALVKDFLRNRLELWRKNQAVMKVMVAEGLFNEELAREISERIFLPGLKQIEVYIAQRIEAGAFRQVDPVVAARGLVGQVLWFGLMQPMLAGSMEIDLDAVTDTLAAIFVNGITADQ